ncbi:hypothetical protein [Flavobacterium sp. UBA7680]|uniref:hypothetical protein n=1 Tax=Flavobacterium sp. UBA7680 TaxID=1946559 RepID=UPI0025B7EBD6|nr:hypothetical protein [Flavobacterium sp. UBA7680]
MKKLFVIIWFLQSLQLIYGQKIKSEFEAKADEINYQVRFIDSIGKQKTEGIIEGIVKYSHGPNKNYGWEAYFFNDEEKKKPLRIKYSETTPKGIEHLNLYYKDGELIYSELMKIEYNRKLKPINQVVKKFIFENNNVLNPKDVLDEDSFYIIEKSKLLVKEIYNL